MATVTTMEIIEENPNSCIKKIYVTTSLGGGATDTFTVDLGSYGIAEDGLLTVKGWDHSTEGSIITSNEMFVTSVTAGTLTIQLQGTAAKYKVFEIVGKGEPGDFS